ncbi:MAG: TetR/AcrR family transcriptional regulator [Alphaproteobacteria bacterium]|nr:TetR/AcrR family transcriptional regulator [Alphaproteobacteria bacterium]
MIVPDMHSVNRRIAMPWEKQFDTDDVLSRAMLAFWNRGYEATSMQDLVDATGVNRGSLYATYGDKHALFLSSLRRYADTVHFHRLSDLESKYEPREAIRHLFLAYTTAPSVEGWSRGCFLSNTALELAAHDRDAGKIVAEAQKRTEAALERIIKQGKASGEFASHVKPAEAAAALLASLIGLSVLTRSRPEPHLLRTIAEDAVKRLD